MTEYDKIDRRVAIDILLREQQAQILADKDIITDMLRTGFGGLEQMTDEQLMIEINNIGYRGEYEDRVK